MDVLMRSQGVNNLIYLIVRAGPQPRRGAELGQPVGIVALQQLCTCTRDCTVTPCPSNTASWCRNCQGAHAGDTGHDERTRMHKGSPMRSEQLESRGDRPTRQADGGAAAQERASRAPVVRARAEQGGRQLGLALRGPVAAQQARGQRLHRLAVRRERRAQLLRSIMACFPLLPCATNPEEESMDCVSL